MDYKEAVRLAREGKDEGFRFLYEKTYKSKYYLALQYMKEEEAAKDVLQESYIKAFSKLDTLKEPEAFAGWLGMIVGNTAKNMLQKKKPLLFTEVVEDDDDETAFMRVMEDENAEHQPELSYTRQETRELVHEMIHSLSEEQRICILMYEIEGIPIKEIAAVLDCSENTVKSRLKYGRKNLKIKAEELQRKGYKLYGIAPLPFFLLLLHAQQGQMSEDGTFALVREQMSERIFSAQFFSKGSCFQGGRFTVESRVKSVLGGAVKTIGKGILHTAAGKTAVLAAVACIAGGAALFGNFKGNHTQSLKEIYTDVLESVKHKDTGYEFSGDAQMTGEIQYFLHDMDKDGIQELIVGAKCRVSAFEAVNCQVYTCRETDAGYELKRADGNITSIDLSIPKEGAGLFDTGFSRGTGDAWVYQIILKDGSLIQTETEYRFTMGDSEWKEFHNLNTAPKWMDISNLNGLDVLN